MKLTSQQLKSISFGAYRFEEIADGYLHAIQHTKEQVTYFKSVSQFWRERCDAGNGKTLELKTKATVISFEYKFLWIGSQDSIEITSNGLPIQLYYVKDLEKEGRVEFVLPEGEKDVVIYLTADATIAIRNFEINAHYTPAKKKEKVLWLGDSITQGYGPDRSSHTYVNVANRYLNYDIINQGIGGYRYDKGSLMKMEGYTPDKIIVSFGTNQYKDDCEEIIEEYYEKLNEIYGETPVLCITPLWRCDEPQFKDKLVAFSETIKTVCAKYPNISVVEGFGLVPCLEEYFKDKLHPNALGAEMYGRNLALQIKKIGF